MIELNEELARKFLAKNDIDSCEIKKIAGDASFRSYYRIFFDDEVRVLMFAPPSHEDIKPFIKIAEFLISHEFSAPQIFAKDEENGFLLLEDLGDDTYGRVLAVDVSKELELYKKACDCLLELHNIEEYPKDLNFYDESLLLKEVMLFVNWYIPNIAKKEISEEEKNQFKSLFLELFKLLSKEEQVLVLRDYHADNLMILPDRTKFKQVGLLDFQDAVIGSKAYDLVSLLEDARRDVDKKTHDEILDYYIDSSNVDKSVLMTDYEILSLQRNIKILGIFARLSVRDKKDEYLKLLPRVENFVRMRVSSKNKVFLEIGDLLNKFL